MRDYYSPEFKAFRRDVRQRDKGQCKWPTCVSKKKIQVHHILPWSKHQELRYMISNGISLCKVHHKLVTGNEYIYAPLLSKLANE